MKFKPSKGLVLFKNDDTVVGTPQGVVVSCGGLGDPQKEEKYDQGERILLRPATPYTKVFIDNEEYYITSQRNILGKFEKDEV